MVRAFFAWYDMYRGAFMPLRDHFHKPLLSLVDWSSFHSNWVTKIVDRLNGSVLSDCYRAMDEVHMGTKIAIDVGAFEQESNSFDDHPSGTNGAVVTATSVYAPPAVLSGIVTFAEHDLFEVRVYREVGELKLVAAIELVSPGNKDRPGSRKAFVRKCGALLAKGVSVVVVDIVTDKSGDLHHGMMEELDLPQSFAWTTPSGLAAIAYRTVTRNDEVRLDAWPMALAVGSKLPTLPLWLDFDLAVPLELESTYEAACQSLRI